MQRSRPLVLRTAVALSAGALLIGTLATAVQAALPLKDQQTLAEMALQWAVGGGLPDVNLLKDPKTLTVADFNLPKNTELKVPGHKVVVASLPRIQAIADIKGDLLYFRFGQFKGSDVRASVPIALLWAVSVKSKEVYLSGGGATLDFEKVNGAWQMLPVTNRWQS